MDISSIIVKIADFIDDAEKYNKFANFIMGNLHWFCIGLFGSLYLYEWAEYFTSPPKNIEVDENIQEYEPRKKTLMDKMGGYARSCLGNRVCDLAYKIYDYVVNKPNPLVQIFYLIVAGGGYYTYVSRVFFVYCPSKYLAGWHRITGSIIMFICYYSFFKASFTDAGIVKKDKKEV